MLHWKDEVCGKKCINCTSQQCWGLRVEIISGDPPSNINAVWSRNWLSSNAVEVNRSLTTSVATMPAAVSKRFQGTKPWTLGLRWLHISESSSICIEKETFAQYNAFADSSLRFWIQRILRAAQPSLIHCSLPFQMQSSGFPFFWPTKRILIKSASPRQLPAMVTIRNGTQIHFDKRNWTWLVGLWFQDVSGQSPSRSSPSCGSVSEFQNRTYCWFNKKNGSCANPRNGSGTSAVFWQPRFSTNFSHCFAITINRKLTISMRI